MPPLYYSHPDGPELDYGARRLSAGSNETDTSESSALSRGEQRPSPLTPADSPSPYQPSSKKIQRGDNTARSSPSSRQAQLQPSPRDGGGRKVQLPSLSTTLDQNPASYGYNGDFRRPSMTYSEGRTRTQRHAPYPNSSMRQAPGGVNSHGFQDGQGAVYSSGIPSYESPSYALNSASSYGSSPLDFHPRSALSPPYSAESDHWNSSASGATRHGSAPEMLRFPPPPPHAFNSRMPQQQQQQQQDHRRQSLGFPELPPLLHYDNNPTANDGYSNGGSTSSRPSPTLPPPAKQALPPLPALPAQPRKRGKLPKETTDYLKVWLHRHADHPYPSEEEKRDLCAATGLSMSQVSNWMINVGFHFIIPPTNC